jgi:Ca2+-transporting ATPase
MVSNEILKIGLSSQQALQNLESYGKNELPEKPPPSDISIFVMQLKSPLVYILLVAAFLTFLLGEFSDTIIIFIAVFINTILGFFQERKANRSLEALKKMLHPIAKVIRDGEQIEIQADELVPQDVIVLFQGDKIPGDGFIIESNRFFVNEAMLTGESVPVEKKEKDQVFMGTTVVGGNAVFQITRTGGNTEMGKIALSVTGPEEDTPLRRQLSKFSKFLTMLVVAMVIFIFIVGSLKGIGTIEILTTAVALAVSAIPEGLLVGLTVVLAIGMQRILKRKGLVRNLVSAETLGGVTTICVDKTGTLTLGSMQVTDVIGNEENIEIQTLVANDMDDPIVMAAFEWSKNKYKNFEDLINYHKRIDSIPFSSDQRLFASLNVFNDENNIIFVNGAPEVLLERCNLSGDDKKNVYKDIDELSVQGKRLLGFARKEVNKEKDQLELKDLEKDLEWLGVLAFNDPVRPDVKDALQKTRQAGIKLVIITGDYAKTAVSVLLELGLDIKEEDTILGDQLSELGDDDLLEKLRRESNVKLFARTKPEQKLRIVELLKREGEVVAMMGDGVNDAPALAKSDIGIVVGDATEVAKETADLVLLDSSFSTIVAAVEEGRGIFGNIRKIILYLLSDGFEEILVVITALIFNLPLPITAAQLLWINLISDGFPHLALTIDPKSKGTMNRPPRSPKEPLISDWMKVLVVIVSVTGGFFAFILFYFSYKVTGDQQFAQSITFATVGINSLIYVFSIRTLRESFWEENVFGNKWLVVAVIFGIFLQVLPFVNPTLRRFLEIKEIGWWWLAVIGASFTMFLIIEILKEVFDHLDKARLRKVS